MASLVPPEISMPWSLLKLPCSRIVSTPELRRPVLFDTLEADRILSTLQIFPPDNPWHEDISARPLHPQSAAFVASIGADKPLGFNLDMNFVIVPPDQPRVPVRIVLYPHESDPGPFPIPDNAPIENWPTRERDEESRSPRSTTWGSGWRP